jgi:hypothetical protein
VWQSVQPEFALWPEAGTVQHPVHPYVPQYEKEQVLLVQLFTDDTCVGVLIGEGPPRVLQPSCTLGQHTTVPVFSCILRPSRRVFSTTIFPLPSLPQCSPHALSHQCMSSVASPSAHPPRPRAFPSSPPPPPLLHCSTHSSTTLSATLAATLLDPSPSHRTHSTKSRARPPIFQRTIHLCPPPQPPPPPLSRCRSGYRKH